jgi:peptide/nickel transport system permease protein
MYLAGSLILLISVLTIIGTLISDLLLALTDPRIRLQ